MSPYNFHTKKKKKIPSILNSFHRKERQHKEKKNTLDSSLFPRELENGTEN